MLLYLHGFNSGPASEKAAWVRDYCERTGRELLCPQLPVHPQEAIDDLVRMIEACRPDHLGLIGSSLGGYYSLYLAQRFGGRAVLINPAIQPYVLLDDYLGWQEHPYTGERYEIRKEHLQELLAIEVAELAEPQCFWLLTQTQDEVLDYRLGVTKLAGAYQTVIEGGNHAFEDFAPWVPAIVEFAEGGLPSQLPILSDKGCAKA